MIWHAEVARAHNLPAYPILHDATLAATANQLPHILADLQGIGEISAKKLDPCSAKRLHFLLLL